MVGRWCSPSGRHAYRDAYCLADLDRHALANAAGHTDSHGDYGTDAGPDAHGYADYDRDAHVNCDGHHDTVASRGTPGHGNANGGARASTT